MGVYGSIYARSLADPEGFWSEAASALHWDRPAAKVLADGAEPSARWFAGGMLNTCFNAVDRHVAAGRGEQAAIIHDSPVTGSVRKISYIELKSLVSRFAGALVPLDVR